MVFRYPDDPSQDYIKRVIGLPGDRIEVRDKRLYINGTQVERTSEGEYVQPAGDIGGPPIAQEFLEKNPEGVEYTILQAMPEATRGPEKTGPWIVPDDRYFMMGDNRDNSADSRFWTQHFVSPEAIKGRAFMIHWSWVITAGDQAPRSFIGDLLFTLSRVLTLQVEKIRWNRIGHSVAGPADKTPPPATQ
jgi:signal peptidase I